MGIQSSRVPHPEFTIDWYRTKLSPEVSRTIHKKSDLQGAIQTLGFLANQLLWLVGCVYFQKYYYQPFALSVFVVMYCVQCNFMINAVHELGHGTVFETKILNDIFCRLFSFVGWMSPDMFFSSHLRHHRYTQNFPFDQENAMPALQTRTEFVKAAVFNYGWMKILIGSTIRAALGRFPTGCLGWSPAWEAIIFPLDKLEARTPAIWWARLMIGGHTLLAFAAYLNGLWIVPPLQLFGPFLFGAPWWLLNTAQHTGRPYGIFPDRIVDDFRCTSRTINCHPYWRFLYWHMNWHCEHHMYAAVPCYNLKLLHEEIKHELPPTLDGLWATWRHIWRYVDKQCVDPSYVEPIELKRNIKKL